MQRLIAIGLLTFVGVATGCDDGDSTGPDGRGTFQLEVSGALEETAEGPAWFGGDETEEGDPVFVLLLGEEDSRHLVLAGREGSARPGVGTYAIGPNGWEVLHLVSDDDELLGMFFADEGEVRITSSSSGVLRGTIDYVATGLLGEAEGEIEGAITFEAIPAPAASALRTMSAVRNIR